MKTLSTIIAATLLAFSAQTTTAAPSNNTVHFKAPAIAGSGCPSGSSDFVITPDGSTLSILFDKYIAESGNKSNNKSCNMAIPVHVPNGFQVSKVTADFRGFVEGRAELRRSYFFAGDHAPVKKTPLQNKYGDDYTVRDNLMMATESWSKCGHDVNMRINSRVRTFGKRSSISVDSLDLSSGVVFHVQYRRCRG
ncbi:MAG: DUF4360 domain-containing protein [Cocleimonas sp.]|nr:DUF4360 domain-containing protein [Cocleimonas sp.]